MKFLSKAIFLLGILTSLAMCKKGEDDPLFSLSTRKARLAGNWKMTSGKATYTGPGLNANYTFDGKNCIAKIKLNNNYYESNEPSYLNLNISKDGVFSSEEFYSKNALNCTGVWNFNTGIGEEKAKESVVFSINEVNDGFTTDYLFNRFSTNFIYKIKELRNKKLVINSSGRSYSNEKGRFNSIATEFVFEQ